MYDAFGEEVGAGYFDYVGSYLCVHHYCGDGALVLREAVLVEVSFEPIVACIEISFNLLLLSVNQDAMGK